MPSVLNASDQMLRAISLVKELAVELSFSGELAPLSCQSTVVAKYKIIMLAFFAYAAGRVVRLRSNSQSQVEQALPSPGFRSELLCDISLLNASLDCMLTWCSSVVPTRGSGSVAGDDTVESGCRYLTTVHDIAHADATGEVIVISRLFPDKHSDRDTMGSNSMKSLLCEIVLPLVLHVGSTFGAAAWATDESSLAFQQSLYLTCVSAGTAVVNILHILFKSCTSKYFIQQCGAYGNGSEMLSGQASDRSLCEMSIAVISSLVSIWEFFLGITSHSFLVLASSWGSSRMVDDRGSTETFLTDARTRLLGGHSSCNMLWSEKGHGFGSASPFLIALIEMTVFVCEKQSVRTSIVYMPISCMIGFFIRCCFSERMIYLFALDKLIAPAYFMVPLRRQIKGTLILQGN